MPYGIVTQTKAGYIKAEIPELDIETDWIQVLSPMSNTNKSQFNISPGTQVYILDEYNQRGELHNQICLGATYNDTDTPPFSATKDGFSYSDSSEISYDQTSKNMKISSALTLDIEAYAVNLGKNAAQPMVSLMTLSAYLALANAAIAKIPAVTSSEIAAMAAALTVFNSGISSIKTPIL